MPDYDFTACLSPIDFELLVKDLLEAEMGIQFENFRDGKDKGIDLRHAPQKGDKATIVQCKRYGAKDFSNLKSKLKNEELKKIKKLKPGKYILATSVSLSPTQVDDLKLLLSPFVQSTSDIYGRERLNSLIRKHSDVERRHNKLWIGSTAIMEELLHSGIHVISREEVKAALASAKLYVKNESFDEALEILSSHRVCIISGIPGIGKTTLARMLLLYFKEVGYEIVKIDDDVSEVRGLNFHAKPKFYYYDDFLGQTSLSSKFNKNEDKRLLAFMDQISKSENSVFVLTTREYILKQAGMIYEPFDKARLDANKCIVDLEKYSRRIRAQILYNHLFFSDLGGGYVEVLVASGKYKDIVDHPNYSPRLIQYLTSMDWVADVGTSGYVSKFLSNLDNPVLLWEHAFERQIQRASQDLLLVMASLPARAEVRDLETAFEAFRVVRSKMFGEVRSPAEFKDALRELDGTFLAIQKVEGGLLVLFHNPSIRDFIEPRVLEDQVFTHLLNGAVFFEQLDWWFECAVEAAEQAESALSAEKCDELERMMIALFGSRCFRTVYRITGQNDRIFQGRVRPGARLSDLLSVGARSSSKKGVQFAEAQLTELSRKVESGDESPDFGLSTIMSLGVFDLEGVKEGSPLVQAIKERLSLSPDEIDDYETWAGLLDHFPSLLGPGERRNLTNNLQQFLEDKGPDLFGFSFDDPDDIRGVAERVQILGRDFGVDTQGVCSSIEEAALEQESRIEEARDWEPDEDGCGRSAGSGDGFSDGEMDSMFRTLE